MSRQYGTRCGFVIPALITRKRLKMHSIASRLQHERTREAELRMIHAVAPSLTADAKAEDSARPAGVHWTIYCNESPGAELAQVYPYLELVTA